MVKYADLRKKVQNMEKFTGCVKIDKPPVINNGFPGQFNLSFTEQPWLDEYGKYIDFDHNYIFSTIPSCIRYSDLYDERTKQSNLTGNNAWKYLGVFEMADLAGMASLKGTEKDVYSMQLKQAKNLIDLLTEFGIDKNRIFPTYQPAMKLSDVPIKTQNSKYSFEFNIPEDKLGKKVFLELGIPEENITPDYSGAPLLQLNLSKRCERGIMRVPSPWGYRNEINFNLGTLANPQFLDIGTLERFAYKPLFDNEKIISLSEIDDTVSIGGVGLERLCMAVNGLDRVQDVDFIKPLYSAMPKIDNQIMVGEYLRAVHRICADLPVAKEKYGFDLKEHKQTRLKFNKMVHEIIKSNLDKNQLRNLLYINSDNQPWHPELKDAVDSTMNYLNEYRRISSN